MTVNELIRELTAICPDALDAEIEACCHAGCHDEDEEHSVWMEIVGVAKMEGDDEHVLLMLGQVMMA